MTVKSISNIDKAHIAHCYAFENMSVNDLASIYLRSPRTIHRVLYEHGIDSNKYHKVAKPVDLTKPTNPTKPKQPALTPQILVPDDLPKLTPFETVTCLFKAAISTIKVYAKKQYQPSSTSNQPRW